MCRAMPMTRDVPEPRKTWVRRKPSHSLLTDPEVLSKQEVKDKANSYTAWGLKVCFKQNLVQKVGRRCTVSRQLRKSEPSGSIFCLSLETVIIRFVFGGLKLTLASRCEGLCSCLLFIVYILLGTLWGTCAGQGFVFKLLLKIGRVIIHLP